jgi:hypothetical protein
MKPQIHPSFKRLNHQRIRPQHSIRTRQGSNLNDGSFGWAVDPTVRDKWQQVPKVATYPAISLGKHR